MVSRPSSDAICPSSSELRAADKGRETNFLSEGRRVATFLGLHFFIPPYFPKSYFVVQCSMRDFQRSRVYRWEDSLPLDHMSISKRRCSFRRCKELIAQAVQLYDLPEIPVMQPTNPRQSTAMYCEFHSFDSEFRGDGIILLPKNFWRFDIALHEVAHYIVAARFHRREDCDHGPVFVRVYMHLLQSIAGADIKVLEQWATWHGLKFSRLKRYAPIIPQSKISRDTI